MHNDKCGSQTIAAFIIILNRIKVRKRESGRITAFCLVEGEEPGWQFRILRVFE